MTYPQFLQPDNKLFFLYREGSSGIGSIYINKYVNKVWSKAFPQPLFSYTNNKPMSAYYIGPYRDATGMWHIAWVWRDNPDAATNHDVSYARSRDLIHWEKSDGKSYSLPIVWSTSEIVHAVPSKGGLLGLALGFDSHDSPIISYHAHDAKNNTQIYNARLESDGWHIYQTSNFTGKYVFGGSGSLPPGPSVSFSKVEVRADGGLAQSYRNLQGEGGIWKLDPLTLKPIGQYGPLPSSIPADLRKQETV